MTEENGYKKAISADVVKFEKDGDSIEGKYLGHERSKQYPDSFAVKVLVDGKPKVCFGSQMLIDLIESNSVKVNMEIKIVFMGKKPTDDGKREYNTYEVFYK